jgi:hypothetical protein
MKIFKVYRPGWWRQRMQSDDKSSHGELKSIWSFNDQTYKCIILEFFTFNVKQWKIPCFVIKQIKSFPVKDNSDTKPNISIWTYIHFASVGVIIRVCKLKPLNRFGPNLAEMFIWRSFTRFVILVQIGNPTWLPGPIICSDWLKLWKSSCQKLLSRCNCNIIEMMTGWSSTKFVIFVPIAYPRWPPQGNNSLPLDPMGISFKDLFWRNYLTNWIFCIMWMFLA